MLGLRLRLSSVVTQTARLARDLWQTINDIWENEQRKWEDIV
jgi:hypothetical protein